MLNSLIIGNPQMNFFIKHVLPIVALIPLHATAVTFVQPETEADRQLDKVISKEKPSTPQIGEALLNTPANNETQTQTLTLSDVSQQPQLSEPLLNQALSTRNYQAAAKLLPIYRTWTQHDPILVDYAQGAIWRSEGKHKKAIALYRKILAQNPHFLAVRLDLAAMLFEDKQLHDATQEFNMAKQEGLPENVLPRVQEYEQAIDNHNEWRFSGHLSYTQDDNINNLSNERTIRLPQFGNLPFEKHSDFLPQQVRGLSYAISAERDINVSGNHYLGVEGSFDGVSYWNNHDYDDQTTRVSLGYRNKSLKTDAYWMPFIEKRRYGNNPYYTRAGFDTGISRWLATRWRASLNSTIAWKDYADNRNGSDRQVGLHTTYLAGSNTYLFGGINWGRDKVNNSAGSSSKRLGGYLGWGQNWAKQFGSRIVLNRYNERYDGKHYIFQDKHRLDKVWVTNVSVWNNKLSFWGITPRLNWRYTKADSNIHALHSYHKQRWFIDFEKSF